MEPNQIWLLFVVNLILTRHFLHIWFCRRLYMLRSVWLVVCTALKKTANYDWNVDDLLFIYSMTLSSSIDSISNPIKKTIFFFTLHSNHAFIGKKGHWGQKWREPCYLFAKNKMIHAVKMVLSIHVFINLQQNLVKTIKIFETFK